MSSEILPKLIQQNILSSTLLPSPKILCSQTPASEQALQTVLKSREEIKKIFNPNSKKWLLIVGPCSIHDSVSALEYAQKLKTFSDKVRDVFHVVMRVYFEKPRTTVGWKGLINDPDLNDSFDIEKGLIKARQILIAINEMGLSCASEALDPIVPQYISNLLAWSAIGARTTESQTHRDLASGLSMPVGIKNGTGGNVLVAINALEAVKNPRSFLGINYEGQVAKFLTSGNPYAHLVLRGGGGKSNFDTQSILEAENLLKAKQLHLKILVDCSHANASHKFENQPLVLKTGIEQILNGQKCLMGFMIESHLNAGTQPLDKNLDLLQYGVSITDECMGFEETKAAILLAYERLKSGF